MQPPNNADSLAVPVHLGPVKVQSVHVFFAAKPSGITAMLANLTLNIANFLGLFLASILQTQL